jgi:vancomycin resistance protein VanJ
VDVEPHSVGAREAGPYGSDPEAPEADSRGADMHRAEAGDLGDDPLPLPRPRSADEYEYAHRFEGYVGPPPARGLEEAYGSGGDGDAGGAAADEDGHHHWPSARQQLGTAIAVLGWAIAAFLVAHRFVPGSAGLVSLLESGLPWLAVPTVILLLGALAARSLRAVLATLAAASIWIVGYGPELMPRGDPLPANLRVFSEDINAPGTATAAELAGAAQLAPGQHADIVLLQGVYPQLASSSALANLNSAYPNHLTQYEFGVWSRYKIADSAAVSLGTTTADINGSSGLVAGVAQVVVGALRVTIDTPEGPLVLYVVHLPQPTLGDQGFAKARDAALSRLVKVVRADHAARLAVVGDVNVAQTDRRFSDLTGLGLTSAQAAAGRGFGFTWPAEFPVVRLDDLLVRGADPVRSVVLSALSGGKTHLPIEVDLHL